MYRKFYKSAKFCVKNILDIYTVVEVYNVFPQLLLAKKLYYFHLGGEFYFYKLKERFSRTVKSLTGKLITRIELPPRPQSKLCL